MERHGEITQAVVWLENLRPLDACDHCSALSSQQALKSVGTNYTDQLEVLNWSGIN